MTRYDLLSPFYDLPGLPPMLLIIFYLTTHLVKLSLSCSIVVVAFQCIPWLHIHYFFHLFLFRPWFSVGCLGELPLDDLVDCSVTVVVNIISLAREIILIVHFHS
jgi:hypothetical protein